MQKWGTGVCDVHGSVRSSGSTIGVSERVEYWNVSLQPSACVVNYVGSLYLMILLPFRSQSSAPLQDNFIHKDLFFKNT